MHWSWLFSFQSKFALPLRLSDRALRRSRIFLERPPLRRQFRSGVNRKKHKPCRCRSMRCADAPRERKFLKIKNLYLEQCRATKLAAELAGARVAKQAGKCRWFLPNWQIRLGGATGIIRRHSPRLNPPDRTRARPRTSPETKRPARRSRRLQSRDRALPGLCRRAYPESTASRQDSRAGSVRKSPL